MFQNLTTALTHSLNKLKGQGRLTEQNIQSTLQEVRRALLEADVALPVVKTFISTVQEAALGQTVVKSLNPGQALIGIVHQELIQALGRTQVPLQLKTTPPVIILMVGLQGSGKTTTTAKLAHYLKTRYKKRIMLTSCDVYRPAAIEQLQMLSKQVQAQFYEPQSTDPVSIAKQALKAAKQQLADVLLVDTAGRLHIDETMMDEIQTLSQLLQPHEILFVVDSMTGQDAAHTASAFHKILPLTGVILTKCDGDARGGAALSVRTITDQPIKFIGTGEKIDQLEPFHPDRIASRILDRGDMLTLIEQAYHKLDQKKVPSLTKKAMQSFTLADFRDQCLQMQQMGGLSTLLKQLPGATTLPRATGPLDDKFIKQTIAIINSMTKQEKQSPKLMNHARKQRVAKGSGTDIAAVNRMLKQFEQAQKMMKKFKAPGALKKLMRNFPGAMPSI